MRQPLPAASRSFTRSSSVFIQAAGFSLKGTEIALGAGLAMMLGTAVKAIGAPVEVPEAVGVLAVVADVFAVRYIGKAAALLWRQSRLDRRAAREGATTGEIVR